MASTITVRDMNQEIVRSCMKGLGPVSKSSLARKTGLSFPTVSKTVDLLCESGEVEVAGTEDVRRSTGSIPCMRCTFFWPWKMTVCTGS